jgi:hypothetical protein
MVRSEGGGVNIYFAGAILLAVCLVLSMIFNWLGEKALLIGIVGGALVTLLFTAGVHALIDANKPPECKPTYVVVC